MTEKKSSDEAWTPSPSQIKKIGERSEPTKEEILKMERVATEHQKIVHLRMLVIDCWNGLEDEMSRLLGVAAGMPDPVAAAILYFSPHSFTTRMQTIDKLIDHFVTSGDKDPAIIKVWTKISGRLRTPKPMRDLAAHGSIVTYNDGKNRVRLSATLGHMHVHLQSYRGGKLPGVGVTELEHAVTAINSRSSEVKAFRIRLQSS